VPFPLQTSGAFKILERKASTPPTSLVAPPAKKSSVLKKKSVKTHPRVVRALKLVDEEDVEAKQPVEASPRTTSQVLAPVKELEVQVIEVSLVKNRKLKKATEPTAPVIETATSVVKVVNMAGFLVARKKQVPPPSVPHMVDVEAFLANEPVLAILMNVVKPVEEPLRAP
jgi:hypothetical protein